MHAYTQNDAMLRISILSSLIGHGQTPNPTLGEQSLLWSYHSYYYYYYYYYTGWMHNQSKRKKTIFCYFMYSMHHV